MACGNRFDLLDDEVAMKIPKPKRTGSCLVLEDTVAHAVASATSGKTTDTSMSAGSDAMISTIISQVLAAIQPIIMQTVTASVTAAMKAMMEELQKSLTSLHQAEKAAAMDGQQSNALAEVERLEQYGRRENIWIYGLEESRGEDTTSKVVELAADMGVAISTSDISVSHRLPISGKSPDAKRPIIVKFVRRSTKQALMKNKKELRKKENRKNVYVEEDLTPLRSRMVRALREDSAVKAVWTIDGRIFVIRKKDGKEEKVVMDSSHDLKKMGWSAERIQKVIRQ